LLLPQAGALPPPARIPLPHLPQHASRRARPTAAAAAGAASAQRLRAPGGPGLAAPGATPRPASLLARARRAPRLASSPPEEGAPRAPRAGRDEANREPSRRLATRADRVEVA